MPILNNYTPRPSTYMIHPHFKRTALQNGAQAHAKRAPLQVWKTSWGLFKWEFKLFRYVHTFYEILIE